ncbi:MAG: type II toxin-antitoxin system MqsA family antitoxin [Thermodesulfobacteriota bacterium]
MKCVICSHGETKAGKTTVPLERDGTLLIIKGVPAHICEHCREGYVADKTVARLLKSTEEGVRAGVQVDVREYLAA